MYLMKVRAIIGLASMGAINLLVLADTKADDRDCAPKLLCERIEALTVSNGAQCGPRAKFRAD